MSISSNNEAKDGQHKQQQKSQPQSPPPQNDQQSQQNIANQEEENEDEIEQVEYKNNVRNKSIDTSSIQEENEFPIEKLNKLNEMINRPRWVIPVMPRCELDILLISSINLIKKGLENELCQRFYRESLLISFSKTLCDDAVVTWKHEIHKCIFKNCKNLIELCALKILSDDYLLFLELLALVFNPNNKFHSYTANQLPFSIDELTEDQKNLPTATITSNLNNINNLNKINNSNNINNDLGMIINDSIFDNIVDNIVNKNQSNKEFIYATSKFNEPPRLWLVELIEDFGNFGGFEKIKTLFQNILKLDDKLNIQLILTFIKPFGLCCEYLTEYTVNNYFKDIIEEISKFIENLTDIVLKKETKLDNQKNDNLTLIIKCLKNLAYKLDDSKFYLEQLEILRLKNILKLLKISSFNGKMNALNEINKVISSVDLFSQIPTVPNHSHYSSFHTSLDEDKCLNSKRVAQWIKDNQVLQIVLKDSLHQPQYVDKLEKIIRFIIKEKQLTSQDLDDLWAAQSGKHEAIVKNVHDLLAKLAWDFAPEQLDHLFECFQNSWITASRKQREKLLELIRTLAEDDKDGVMAHKVLNLLWSLAHSSDLPTEIMDQALAAHFKILDYSCCQDRDTQKYEWLNRCIEELTKENPDPNWVIPALKQIREICLLYCVQPNHLQSLSSMHQRMNNIIYRQDVIARLQNEHNLIDIVSKNLQEFIDEARNLHEMNPNLNPNCLYGNNRYSHVQEVKERLSFLRFLLKEGKLLLCEPQATKIWQCLIQNSVYKEDREEAFSWFSKLMNREPDLDPDLNRSFLENQILKLDPVLLTESGIECFDKFFKAVNLKEGKLIYHRGVCCSKDLDLIGLDYLTRIVLNGQEEVSNLAIELLKAIYSNLSNCLQSNKLNIIKDFTLTCMDRLSAFYKTIELLTDHKEKEVELIKMTRFLKLLYEYLNQCDLNYGDERIYLPMLRSFRGKNTTILVRLQNPNRTGIEDILIDTHSNETILNVKKQYLNKLNLLNANVQVDFYLNGEHLDQEINRDKKIVSHLTKNDRFMLTAKIVKTNSNNDNEIFSQSNSSQFIDNINHIRFENGINEEAENCLPSVYMSNDPDIYKLLFDFADLGLKLNYKPIYINSFEILKLMPIDKSKSDILIKLSKNDNLNDPEICKEKDLLLSDESYTKLCYTLGVIYSLLMPASNPLSDNTLEFQVNFIKSGLAYEIQKFITKKDFLNNADDLTKLCAYSIILKISKFVLKTIANYLVLSGINKQIDQFRNLPKCLERLQNLNEDFVFFQTAKKTANSLINLKKQQKLNNFKYEKFIPNLEMINFILYFIWTTASGKEEQLPNDQTTIDSLHQLILDSKPDPESTVYNICKQGLEVLTMMLMLSPNIFSNLKEDKKWESFTMDLILFASEKSVRISACEQFVFISTTCSTYDSDVIRYYIEFLNYHLEHTIPKNYKTSYEFFQLYCKLLNNACTSKLQLPEIKKYLNYEIDLLKNVKERLLVDGLIEDIQLEGHLNIVKELVLMLNSEEKYKIGCKFASNDDSTADEQYDGLLVVLIDEYIFTASRLMVVQNKLSQRNNFGNSGGNSAIFDNLVNQNNSTPNSPYNSLSCIYSGDVDAICSNSETLNAAFDLIVALCIGCVPNLKYICDNLTEMFYSEHAMVVINEWDYCPQIGKRGVFSGLKNAAATCYMNSILQQLYMIPEIRDGLLSVEGAIDVSQAEFYEDDAAINIPMNYSNTNNQPNDDDDDNIKNDYNVGVVKHVQAIFGNLALNKLQSYVPKGFWYHFKLWGEPINLREQHDALEFFNSLVDSIDEGLKKLKYNKLMASVFSGSFADQKICKDCIHRYSREESFTALNIDIRNHSNLLESLEQYVKGDLLEGANAYYCEKCNRKVDTVKRLCIKKLPIILTIQLKRFDYNWDRGCAMKFNDYFEFPRLLDMEPYTVNGLAKIDGEIIEDIIERENIDYLIDIDENNSCDVKQQQKQEKEVQCTKYELCGIVIHSGQASGGHYYSYILHTDTDGNKKWYKFDDGDVSEVKLDQDEEMKNQCFGGDYYNEVFDQMLKKVTCKKQKRWWSAYILFYRRIDTEQNQLSLRLNELVLSNSNINSSNNLMRTSSSTALIKQNSGDSEIIHQQQRRTTYDTNIGDLFLRIPTPIRRSVQRQNIKFMHLRNQFNPEYFNFIKHLTSSNHDLFSGNYLNNDQKENSLKEICLDEQIQQASTSLLSTKLTTEQLMIKKEISLLCTKLLSRFLFSTCFHTKKTLRGSAYEWYEILTMHLRVCVSIRGWFAHSVFIENQYRFSEYILDCIIPEIRNVFIKLVIFIAHYALQDGNPQFEFKADDGSIDQLPYGEPLSDYIIGLVLSLLKRDGIERHLNVYFNLFTQYVNASREARLQLIKLNVLSKFMNIALDDSMIPSLKQPYPEFGKLCQVVSILVRSCDISNKCRSCNDSPIQPNPFSHDSQIISNLPDDVSELLFDKQNYVKKVIEDATTYDETFLFLKYCCYENPRFSFVVLEELVWHILFYYDNELKPYLDLLFHVLIIQDSWQQIRILNALNGNQLNEKEGVLDAILREKKNFQKRAYQCIKFLVTLFTNCKLAAMLLQTDHDIGDKFIAAVNWLNEELDYRSFNSTQQFNFSWGTNDTKANCGLVRSNSARLTLSKAINLCPKEEEKQMNEVNMTDDSDDNQPQNSNSSSNNENQNTSASTDATSSPKSNKLILDSSTSPINDRKQNDLSDNLTTDFNKVIVLSNKDDKIVLNKSQKQQQQQQQQKDQDDAISTTSNKKTNDNSKEKIFYKQSEI